MLKGNIKMKQSYNTMRKVIKQSIYRKTSIVKAVCDMQTDDRLNNNARFILIIVNTLYEVNYKCHFYYIF